MRKVALVGNPNVGKSTLFNALTGLRQHTGNWPGKTVEVAQGKYDYKGREYFVTDLPGTYSLVSHSPEEAVTEEYLLQEGQDWVLALCDATCLERSLILVLQVLSCRKRVIVCVNLMDEAEKEGIQIDVEGLERYLGVPVLALSAGRKEGIERLRETLRQSFDGFLPLRPHECACQLRGGNEESSDEIAAHFAERAQEITRRCVCREDRKKPSLTARLDRVLLHPVWGYGVLLLLLLGVFWLTMQGANYPSQGLQWCFDRLGELLRKGAYELSLPGWLTSALLDGVYATVCRVVAVMLPPMAIFFPLFTLLEDFGYLPRVAFLMDHFLGASGACGKQALTMCMGLGCNAAGVTGCRIIHSPRERLIAVLTNAFVPCNGRFPALLFLISLSFSGGNALAGALTLVGCLLLSVAMTLLASRFLSKTALKGESSSFLLELPPYRRPRVGQVLLRSMLDRTLFVLGRAVMVAAPAGALIWCLANLPLGESTLLLQIADVLDAPGKAMGMSGALLLAFLLGSPANELVLPVFMMILTAGGTYGDQSNAAMGELLGQTGWTWQMSACAIVFFLFHWPCTTTLLTVKKETGSLKWTALAALLPTAFGVLLCLLLSGFFYLFG